MHLAVLLPQIIMRVRGMAAEQRAFQRGIIAEHHRKGVERQDIACLDNLVGHRIVRAVSVDAGLEPGPCIHQFNKRKAVGNAAHHGGCRGKRDLMLWHAGFHRRHQRPPANGTHIGALADQNMFLGALDRPQRHGRCGAIDKFHPGKMHLQHRFQIKIDLVKFDTKPLHITNDLFQRGKIAVTPPVTIGDIVADRPTPGLAAINASRHGGDAVAVQHRAIAPSELAIQKAGEIADIVIGGEQAGINAVGVHACLHGVTAACHFAIRKRRERLFAIMPAGDVDQFICSHGLSSFTLWS